MEKIMRNPFLPITFDYFETVATEDLPKIKPLNGEWKNLDNPNAYSVIYNFDATKTDPNDSTKIIKDVCGTDRPAYDVRFSGNDYGHEGISISFYRCGRTADHPEGFGGSVFQGVQRAIYDYVMARKPFALNWTPVSRSDGQARERERQKSTSSRHRVYEMLSISHLFPDYVSYKPNHWLRRDLYEKVAAPEGMPPVEDEIKVNSPLAKKKAAINDMRQKSSQKLLANANLASDIVSKINEFGIQIKNKALEDIKAKRLEALNLQINDPQQNPHRLKVDDLVHVSLDYPEAYKSYLNVESSHSSVQKMVNSGRDYGKIADFKFESVPWENGNKEMLLAKVFLVDSSNEEHHDDSQFTDYYIWLPANLLEKYGHEKREGKRMSRLQKLLDNETENPKRFQIGQEIICVPDGNYAYKVRRNADGFQNAGVGEKFKITDAYIDPISGSIDLKAKFLENVLEAEVPDWLSAIINPSDVGVYSDRTIGFHPKDRAVKHANSTSIAKVKIDYKKVYDALSRLVVGGENRLGLKKGDQIVFVKSVDISEIAKNLPIGQIGKVHKIILESSLVPDQIEIDNVEFIINWTNKNILEDDSRFIDVYAGIGRTLSLAKSNGNKDEKYSQDDVRIKKLNEESQALVKNNFEKMYKKYQEIINQEMTNSANKYGLKPGDEVIVTSKKNPKFIYNFCQQYLKYIGVGKLLSFKLQISYDFLEDQNYTSVKADIEYDVEKTQALTGQKSNSNRGLIDVGLEDCLDVVPYNPAQILNVKNLLHNIQVVTKTSKTKDFIDRQVNKYYSDAGAFHTTDGDKIFPKDAIFYNVNDEWHRGIYIGNKNERLAYVAKNTNTQFEEVPYEDIKSVNPQKSKAKKSFLKHGGTAFLPTSSPDAIFGMVGLALGDPVDVVAGEHANKSGHIVSWRRLRGVPFASPSDGRGDMGAVISTYPSPDKPSETIVVPASSLKKSETLHRFESFSGFLSLLNRFLVERL